MVYRLILSYRGAAYAGWQRQPNALTVQEVVEAAIEDLFEAPLRVVAAGRTDAGVHARGQVVSLRLERPFPPRGLVHALNHRLPEDVRILDAHRMPDGFHATKCAAGKIYHYRLSRAPVISPMDSWWMVPAPPDLDLAAMRRATRRLIGRHDFSAFAQTGGSHAQPFRRIGYARWREDGDRLRFEVFGEGFLRGMVRALVGTLLEVGSGKRSEGDISRLLEGGPRSAAGPNAPALGLVLERVVYPAEWSPLPPP